VNRNRVTILQSLRPLIRGFYLRKHKIQPDKIKSKLYFTPTEKGICYALAYLDLDIHEVEQEFPEAGRIREYIEMVRDMRNKEGGSILIKNIAELTIQNDCFSEGHLSVTNEHTVFIYPYLTAAIALSLSNSLPLFTTTESAKFKKVFVRNNIPAFETSVRKAVKKLSKI
jgi:hypothetical protein